MHSKKYVQLNAAGICFHEFEYTGRRAPRAGAELMDVTARTDGPWLGKQYDAASDTFAWPEPTATLTVSASSTERGGKVTLRWETEHAVSAEIDQGVGALDPVEAGEVELSPERTTTYELTATGREGTTPATVRRRVTVTAPAE